jgi:hypothetical protein
MAYSLSFGRRIRSGFPPVARIPEPSTLDSASLSRPEIYVPRGTLPRRKSIVGVMRAKVTHCCVADVIWPFTLKVPAQRHDEQNGDFHHFRAKARMSDWIVIGF